MDNRRFTNHYLFSINSIDVAKWLEAGYGTDPQVMEVVNTVTALHRNGFSPFMHSLRNGTASIYDVKSDGFGTACYTRVILMHSVDVDKYSLIAMPSETCTDTSLISESIDYIRLHLLEIDPIHYARVAVYIYPYSDDTIRRQIGDNLKALKYSEVSMPECQTMYTFGIK